jgi:hypothetical protein
VPGPVILDLGGFTIFAYPNSGSSVAGISVQSNPTGSRITIRNGGITMFQSEVQAGSSTSYLSNVHFEHLSLQHGATGVSFIQVNSSTVSDCSFTDVYFGIQDEGSQGGNDYVDDSFDGNQSWTLQAISNGPIVLEHCHFEAPAN